MVEIRKQGPAKRLIDNFEEDTSCGKKRRLSYQSESDGKEAKVQWGYQKDLARARAEANHRNYKSNPYGGKRRRTSKEALTDGFEVKFLKRKSDGEESDEEMQKKKKSKLSPTRPDGSSQDELSRGSTRRKSRAAMLRDQSPLRVNKGPSMTRGGRGWRAMFQTAEYQRVQNTVDSNGYSASQVHGFPGGHATHIPDSQNSDVQDVSTAKAEQPAHESTNASAGPDIGSHFDMDESTQPSPAPDPARYGLRPKTGKHGAKASAAPSSNGKVPQAESDSEDELAHVSPTQLLLDAKDYVITQENLKDQPLRTDDSAKRTKVARADVPANRGMGGGEKTRGHGFTKEEITAATENAHGRHEQQGPHDDMQNIISTPDPEVVCPLVELEGIHYEFPVWVVVYNGDIFEQPDQVLIFDLDKELIQLSDELFGTETIVHTSKIIKVICHEKRANRCWVRLETSRTGTRDTKVDIEFRTFEHYVAFVTQLCNRTNLDPTTKTPHYLERAALKRTIELKGRIPNHLSPMPETPRDGSAGPGPSTLGTPTGDLGDDHRHQKRKSDTYRGDGSAGPGPSKLVMPTGDLGDDHKHQDRERSTYRGDRSAGPGPSKLVTPAGDLGDDHKRQHRKSDIYKGDGDEQSIVRAKADARVQRPARSELNRRHSGIDELLDSVGAPRQTRSRAPQNKHEVTETAGEQHDEAKTTEAQQDPVFDLGEAWKHPLVYPPTGRKKVTVDFEDLERLDEGQLLNDNLVEFALRYIKEQHAETTKSVYQFNTFFYSTLTKAKRGQRINYDAVKMWTRNIDIFAHDFVVVPINESYHWYVAIICNLPALKRKMPKWGYSIGIQEGDSILAQDLEDALAASDEPAESGATGAKANGTESWNSPAGDTTTPFNIHEDDDAARDEDGTAAGAAAALPRGDERQGLGEPSPESPGSSRKRARRSGGPRVAPDEPAIITLDSLGGTHPQTIRALKDYLVAEARAKRGGMELDAGRVRGMTGKGIPLQQNFSDCGLYLLGYAEKFAEDPRAFAATMLRREFDAEEDWPHLDPADMRAQLRRRLMGLHEVQEADRKGAKKAKKGKKAAGAAGAAGGSRSGSAAGAGAGGEDVVAGAGGGGAVRGQPELEVPRTPEPDNGSGRPAGRAAVAAAGRAQGRILVPDSQEGSAYAQLASAAAGAGGSGVGHPRTPARPPTRGKAAAATAEREVEVVDLED